MPTPPAECTARRLAVCSVPFSPHDDPESWREPPAPRLGSQVRPPGPRHTGGPLASGWMGWTQAGLILIHHAFPLSLPEPAFSSDQEACEGMGSLRTSLISHCKCCRWLPWCLSGEELACWVQETWPPTPGLGLVFGGGHATCSRSCLQNLGQRSLPAWVSQGASKGSD